MSDPGAPRLFVIAGMPRTGTTSLYHLLGAHPGIFQPYRKEVASFLFNHRRGDAWKRSLYRDCSPGQIGLDVTPEYFFSQDALARLAAWAPPVRVALGIRDPGEVAVSLYREYGRRRWRMPAIDAFLREWVVARGGETVRFSIAAGDIGRRLDAWRDAFGDRLLLYDFRLLQRDPVRVLGAIERFLGLAPHFDASTFENLHLNADGRRNSRLVSIALNDDRVIAVLERAVPRRLLTRLARGFYRASETTPRSTTGAAPRIALPRERDLVTELFAVGPLVLGTGRRLDG
jgi:hypothetical protein